MREICDPTQSLKDETVHQNINIIYMRHFNFPTILRGTANALKLSNHFIRVFSRSSEHQKVEARRYLSSQNKLPSSFSEAERLATLPSNQNLQQPGHLPKSLLRCRQREFVFYEVECFLA